MTVAVCEETRNRIRLSVAAFAYEFEDSPIMSDAEFDRLARRIMPFIATGSKVEDHFFSHEFTPDSGLWIRRHPNLDGIRRIYSAYYVKTR